MGYQMNTQTDKRWGNEIMTQGPGWKDLIWRWGCVITSLANVMQWIQGFSFTPKDMNDIILDIKGYAFLNDPMTPENSASFILWDKVKIRLEKLVIINNRIPTSGYLKDSNRHYIAKVTHRIGGSHYINVIGKVKNDFTCFDVEDGLVKSYPQEQIHYLHEVIRK